MNDILSAAIHAGHSGLSSREAAKELGIPRSTLQRRLKTPFPRKVGGQTTFAAYAEDLFVTMLEGFAAMRLPLTRRKFLSLVRQDANRKGMRKYNCEDLSLILYVYRDYCQD